MIGVGTQYVSEWLWGEGKGPADFSIIFPPQASEKQKAKLHHWQSAGPDRTLALRNCGPTKMGNRPCSMCEGDHAALRLKKLGPHVNYVTPQHSWSQFEISIYHLGCVLGGKSSIWSWFDLGYVNMITSNLSWTWNSVLFCSPVSVFVVCFPSGLVPCCHFPHCTMSVSSASDVSVPCGLFPIL